ncbi:RNA polymerase subunit sigma-24 [Mangrovimonas yunxiaonensis]|uniref:RNA polymerase subunit sigma-24 n=1 Tax=Mangrovimonas yunxiaonensis TaxID=1197477 RepID=A0A084TIH1_9FLAO|nr:sigma-70 family RNA polymerase sigma factor [Mangrovimonas yunxiaonensis]KFB00507.1 RNA polymerase subunit sigma-24 [Mangrovimonas yunxiaonensis]MBR9758578.1 sigma-70 family RNA polymerase sigma factor [Algicola sp.]GGH34304.1 hypothetical protein GCM10011364_00070 [Mangrovimonas yunxiaonensis]
MENTNASHHILKALRSGSERTQREVYEANRDKFLNFAKRYALSEEDVIDVYQDAYIIFYNNIVSGKLEVLTSSISTYLFSIGKNLIMDRLRKQKRQLKTNDYTHLVQDETSDLSALDLEPEALSEEQELLRTHFGTLGKKCQEILTLFYYRGFTISEILEFSDYNSENVIKSQKSRCLKTLRELIKSNTI